jgi:hypothetical protein
VTSASSSRRIMNLVTYFSASSRTNQISNDEEAATIHRCSLFTAADPLMRG